MTVHILMPSIAPGIDTARLTRWMVDEGARIAPGDVIAEIETDTVTMEIEASQSGMLLRRIVTAGPAELATGTPIADVEPDAQAQNHDQKAASASAIPPQNEPTNGSTAKQDTGSQEETQAPVSDSVPPPQRHPVTPAARAMAREAEIDLTAIKGTGPGGRILKADIEARIAELQSAQPSPADASQLSNPSADPAGPISQASPAPPPSAGSMHIAQTDPVRAIGPVPVPVQLPQEAAAHLVMVVDCRIDELLRTRDRINLTAPPRDGRPREKTLAGFYIRAAHQALVLLDEPFEPTIFPDQPQSEPGKGGTVLTYARMTAAGLTSRHFTQADLGDIEAIAAVLASTPSSPQNQTNTQQAGADGVKASHQPSEAGVRVLDLGTFRIQRAHGMIAATDDVLLAIGASERRPVASGERISIATVVTATLTIYARRIDPAAAAACLEQFRTLLEAPRSLIFERPAAHELLR